MCYDVSNSPTIFAGKREDVFQMSNRIAPITGRLYTVDYADIVIIGNGIAGLTAAIEARRLAPDRSIVMITEQCHPTINTPALKQFAMGKLAQEQLLAYPAGTERRQHIRIVNARVEGINAEDKYLYLPGGYSFGYGSLLIATGSAPNGLPEDLPGRDFDGVLTLHRLHDYLNLRRRLHEVKSAVVIGSGAHAIETAMALLQWGIEVYWLMRGEIFLSRMLDRPASQMVLEHARNAGVKIYTNTEAVGIVGRVGSVIGVVTNQHQLIPCQLVLACTGTKPVTTLAERCTLPIAHREGILVDEQFRTSVKDIYAAGDVAAWKNPQTGRYETHGQWYAAVQQGRIAAAAMTGHYDPAQHSLGVSWHATHLGELCMLTVGSPLSAMKGAVVLAEHGKKRYCRMIAIGGKLLGYLWLGAVQPDSLAIKRLIDEGHPIQGVQEALLKGKFDARKYFSRRKTYTLKEIITSGKLPAIISRTGFELQGQFRAASLPVSGDMEAVPGKAGRRETEPLRARAWIYDQPTIHVWQEEAKLVTGELATSEEHVPEERIVDSILVPLPSRAVSRSLWSYSEEVPAVKTAR